KIARGEIPSKKVHEDDDFVAFRDLNPGAPVPLLLFPRRHAVPLRDMGADDAGWVGRMVTLASALAAEHGCRPGPEGGFRLMANSGAEGGQEVPHLHLHILGGQRPWKGRMAPNA